MAGKRSQKVDCRKEIDFGQGLPNLGIVIAGIPVVNQVDVDAIVIRHSQQHHVVSDAGHGVREDGAVGKHVQERAHLAPDGVFGALVKLHEDRHHSTRIEPRFHQRPELLGVQRGGALDPGVEGIGRDAVEGLIRRLQKVPSVVDQNRYLLVLDDAEVEFVEVFRNHLGYQGLDFGNGDVAGPRVDADGPRGDSRAESDDEEIILLPGQERGEVSEHPLQTHVLRIARRLDLAGIVIIENAVGLFGDSDRSRQALSHVDHVRVDSANRQKSPVGDHFSGNLRDDGGEHHRAHHGHRGRDRGRRAELLLGRRAKRRKHQQPRHSRHDDQDLLRRLASDPGDNDQARAQRSHDRSNGVRRVETAHQPSRVLTFFRRRCQGQGKTCPPEHGGRQHGPEAPRQIHLQPNPGRRLQRDVHRPVRQCLGHVVGGPGHGDAEQDLAISQRRSRRGQAAADRGTRTAADAKPQQEYRQDQCETIDGRTHHERQMTCPQDFGREGRHSRNADGCVHGPDRVFMWFGRILVGGFRGPHVTGPGTNDQGNRRHGGIDRDRGKRRDDNVVLAQQVEAGQHCTQNGAADIAAIEEAEPCHAARRGLHPTGNRRQRRTHQ